MCRDNIFAVVCVIIFTLMTLGCGGEGAGSLASQDATSNTISSFASNEPVNITGSVYVIKDSQFSQLNNPPTLMARIIRFFVPNSFAAFSGSAYDVLTQLTTGTVELFRLASDGSILTPSLGTAPILETAPSSGIYKYSFPDNLLPSSTLMVSVQGAPVPMRAFVYGADVDITPASEAVVNTLIASLAVNGTTLNNYDAREVGALTGVATGRVDLAGLTFADAVTKISNDAATTLDSLIASYAGYAGIGETFTNGSAGFGSDGYTLAEHSIQFADQAGDPTAFAAEAADGQPPYSGPTHGVLLRGSQNGGFSVSSRGEGLSAGRMYPMGTDYNSGFGVSFNLRDAEYGENPAGGTPTWSTEFNDFIVTPAPNGQVVFQTEGGRSVVGFVTRDKQIVVLPFDKTIPQSIPGSAPPQEIRGAQVMLERWDINPPNSGSYNTPAEDRAAGIAKVVGDFNMIEYLHRHASDLYEISVAHTNGVAFDGLPHAGSTDDFKGTDPAGAVAGQVGYATKATSYPYSKLSIVPPGFINRGDPRTVLATTGTQIINDNHIAKAQGDAWFDYTVHMNGQVQLWIWKHHVGEAGVTPDGEVMIFPVNPYFAEGGDSAPNVRGYLAFGKATDTITPAKLAATYNIVGVDTYLTDANGFEVQHGNRYGTLTLLNTDATTGTVTGGEFFKSTGIANVTNMINTIGTVVSTSTAREVVTGGSYTLDPTTGNITAISINVETVGTPLKTVTMTGSGFAAKDGDFMTLQLEADDTATSGERSIMYLGKQF